VPAETQERLLVRRPAALVAIALLAALTAQGISGGTGRTLFEDARAVGHAAAAVAVVLRAPFLGLMGTDVTATAQTRCLAGLM
jgi:hypothetical protein